MIGHQWTGYNGARFDLTSPTASGVWLRDGEIEGLHFVEEDEFVRRSPSVSGQSFLGSNQTSREVFWPVVIDGTDGSWFEVQKRFWGSLRPGRYGVWRVTAPDGTWRELRCRHVPRPAGYSRDPSYAELEVRGVDLVADDPWWYGQAVSRVFGANDASPMSFFDASGAAGRQFYLGSGFSSAAATIENVGDVAAWPKWMITGPLTGFSVGVGDDVLAATITLDATESVLIDTNPKSQLARRSDGSLIPFAAFSSLGFASVPEGESVPLSVSVSGAGTVEVSIAPRFYRAF